MDIDDEHQPTYTLQPTNALAGPSSTPETPSLFLPPPGFPQPPPHLTSTQDLLTRFHLLEPYNKYVRPFAAPVSGTQGVVVTSGADKGKGKERDVSMQDMSMSSPVPATPAAGNDGDDDDANGKGEKKWKNYKHLIKGIPGKHSMKKDDYLMTMMQVPPKQKMAIKPFGLTTQREAFSVSLEGLKGWNINTLVAESPQAREDRKKRKELKRLAKVQGQGSVLVGSVSAPTGLPTTPTSTVVPTPGASVSMPQMGVPKAATRIPPPSVQNTAPPQIRTPVGIGTPQSISTPGPTSNMGTTPLAAGTSPTMQQDPSLVKRGFKRERDNSSEGLPVNGTGQAPSQVNNGAGTPKPMVVSAKAGNAGIRPRPLKRPRLDSNTQAREMPIQQPTPHA